MKRILLTLSVMVISALSLHAQRTSPGSLTVNAEVRSGLGEGLRTGVSAGVGTYLLDSHVAASAGVFSMESDDSGTPFRYNVFLVSGDWRYRLIASYDRSFNLYAGGGPHLGFSGYPKRWRDAQPQPVDGQQEVELSEFHPVAFIYGAQAGLDAEYYFTRRFALTAAFTGSASFRSYDPVSQGGQDFFADGIFNLSLAFGLRVTL